MDMKGALKNAGFNTNPKCFYCGKSAKLVSGAVIYTHRTDLSGLNFWLCEPCDAYVGCHRGTEKSLGTLANAELRRIRSRLHAAFDPIWQEGHMKRRSAYKWLSKELNISPDRCHIAMFVI